MTAAASELPLADQLKRVLRYMPAPVSIVTSADPSTGEPIGLAMSAIMPMALEPCSMAIAVNRSGSAYAGLIANGRYCINLLGAGHGGHMTPFASAELRQERFRQDGWAQHEGLWHISDAPAAIFCELRERVSYGTHDLLIGEVWHLHSSGHDDIMGWCNGMLGRLSPLAT